MNAIYAPNFFSLKDYGLPGLARELYGLIKLYAKNSGKAFICRKVFAEQLRCAKGSISRAVRQLVDKGLIKKTGEFFNYLFPYVEIVNDLAFNKTANEDAKVAETASLCTPNLTVTGPSPAGYTNKKIEKFIKQTTEEIVCFDFSKNSLEDELSAPIASLKDIAEDKLRGYGVRKKVARSWINRFELENINNQLDTMADQIKNGTKIQNPAAWLNKAIRTKYALATVEEKSKQEAIKIAEEDKSREAYDLMRKAELEENREPQRAKKLAEQSLRLKESTEAKELIARIDAQEERKRRIEEARKNAPRELLESLIKEATENVHARHRQFGFIMRPNFVRMEIEAEVEKKLLLVSA